MITAHFINGPLHGTSKQLPDPMWVHVIPMASESPANYTESAEFDDIVTIQYQRARYDRYYYHRPTQDAYYRLVDDGNNAQS